MTYAQYKNEAADRARNDAFAASCIRWAVVIMLATGRKAYLCWPNIYGQTQFSTRPEKQFKSREAAEEAAVGIEGAAVELLPSSQWED